MNLWLGACSATSLRMACVGRFCAMGHGSPQTVQPLSDESLERCNFLHALTWDAVRNHRAGCQIHRRDPSLVFEDCHVSAVFSPVLFSKEPFAAAFGNDECWNYLKMIFFKFRCNIRTIHLPRLDLWNLLQQRRDSFSCEGVFSC